MDRFIVDTNGRLLDLDIDLKSNMDRFIETCEVMTQCKYLYLKSNMDRFIGFLAYIIYDFLII